MIMFVLQPAGGPTPPGEILIVSVWAYRPVSEASSPLNSNSAVTLFRCPWAAPKSKCWTPCALPVTPTCLPSR